MIHRWKDTARNELCTFRAQSEEARRVSKYTPLQESLRQINDYVNSLDIRIIQTKIPRDLIRIMEKGNHPRQTLNFEEFLRLLYDLKLGTDFTQYVPQGLHQMLEGYACVPLFISLGQDTAENLGNLLVAIKNWRVRTSQVIDFGTPLLAAIEKTIPNILTSTSGDSISISEKLNLVREVTDAYVAYQLIINVTLGLSSEELREVRSSMISDRAKTLLDIASINSRIQELEASLAKNHADLFALHQSRCVFETNLAELRRSNKVSNNPAFKKEIKDCYRTISTLNAEMEKLREKIISATIERSNLLRKKVNIIFPCAILELRAQSEIPFVQSGTFTDEPALELVIEQKKEHARTPRETNDVLIAHLPRLYAMLMQPTDAEKAEGERIRTERKMKKEMRQLERRLKKENVPPTFISERINAGEKDAENILRQYAERKCAEQISPAAETGSARILKFAPKSTLSTPTTIIKEKTLRHLVNQLVYARFGVRSVDALEKTQKDMLSKKMREITAFLNEYLEYLRQPKGNRGAFMSRNDQATNLFVEKFWITTTNPGGWRAFSIQAGGDARIVLCVRPENEEISLLMAEPNHDMYTMALARFNCERDIPKRVILSAEEDNVSIRISSK